MAPVLGAIADSMGRRKAMLLAFAFFGIVVTASLYFVAAGSWQWAACLYVLAVIGFSGSNIFYDSLLVFVARGEAVDRVSALGFALGYLGGGLLLGLNIFMSLHPDWFGLGSGNEAIRVSFILVAGWWLVFTLPLVLLVPEPDSVPRDPMAHLIYSGFRHVFSTLREVSKFRNITLFLAAYWLYIDGVDTIVRMAVDYGLSLGFDVKNLILALLITQFVGFPAALVFGFLGNRLGAKAGIFIALSIYIFVTIWGAMMRSPSEFYFLAASIGLVQGGIQALSRSLYARLIPAEHAAEFFGFYNMMGKFAAVIGPIMMGWFGAVTGSPRIGILSLLILFLTGGYLLMKVELKDQEPA